MRLRIVAVLVLALAAVALLGGAAYGATVPAPPYETNAACLECHDVTLGGAALSKVDFAVPDVDMTSCRTCHAFWWGDPSTSHEHGGLRDASGEPQQCSACHHLSDAYPLFAPEVSTAYGWFATADSPSSSAARIHEVHVNGSWPDAIFNNPSLGCVKCHAPAACSTCHTGVTAHGDHALPTYPAITYRQTTGLRVVTTAATCVNAGCHPRVTLSTTPLPPCGTCHSDNIGVHGYDSIDHVATDASLDGTDCSACHTLDLATAHGDPGAAGASCTMCHPSPRDTFGAWDQTCATGGCHTASSTRPMHADIDTSHAVSESNTLCLDCHAGTELASVHVDATDEVTGKASCFVCHTGAIGEPVTNDCTVCHFTFEDHYGAERHTSSWAPLVSCGGAECHSVSGDLMTVHEEKNASFTCAGCHSDFSVARQIQDGLTGCGDCHDGVTQTSGHRDVHVADPPLETATHVPNYAYYTGSTGIPKTTDCLGCHTSNLVDEHLGLFYLGNWIVGPRFDSSGAALTCATCHSSEDSTVLDAIEAGLSSCESCHEVHGPIAAVHEVTFDTTTGVDCAQCHSSQLETEHNGTYTTTTPSGRELAGCAVCHSYWEGERGALVESVISASGQTQCSACHGTEHPDLGSHTVSSDASQACAVCHEEGGTSSIDVKAVHAEADLGACAVCHSNKDRVGDISNLSAECSSCHATEGTDYHSSMDSAHTYTAMDASCTGVGCHAANTLPEEHERFLSRYPGYTTSCALCHDNANAGRIDWGSATASCDSCHTVHGDIDVIHTAQTAEGCESCHKTSDALVLHIDDATGETDCAACHNGTTTLPRPLTCGGCHATEGTDYHLSMDSAHTYTAMDGSCTGAGCHAANTLPEEHERFLDRYPDYDTTCALCHDNANAGRIDWASATASCDSCHTVHGDIDVIHTATASQGCVDCHNTGDTFALHSTPSGSVDCALCHAAPSGRIDWTTATIECASCHGSLQPVETQHYPSDAHASVMSSGCANCHSMDLKAEHFRSAVNIGCVACHQQSVSQLSGPWDKTCDACHPTRHKDRVGGPGGGGGGKGGGRR